MLCIFCIEELCINRFRVKIEVTDDNATTVFLIFDSEMSYLMEKSCAYFVARSKVSLLVGF
jgi:hypothetical protein